ncbi:iron chaperone [Membranihabitans marinus]|uniref:iron chaperone n=1 Tax=Membranihabitans marinus TaxID=1227546 RepID=UPI001F21F660|nr:DUF1801 domain-containing protein [Membranihabitans marinus]
MQYDVKDPQEYLQCLEEDWRKSILNQIRNMILSHDDELQEGIQYKMLSYGIDGSNVFHLNAQKNYVSLYVGDINKVENSEHLLSAFDTGKGCIRIKKKIELSNTGLNEFIGQTIKYWREGGDTSC